MLVAVGALLGSFVTYVATTNGLFSSCQPCICHCGGSAPAPATLTSTQHELALITDARAEEIILRQDPTEGEDEDEGERSANS